jgi:hypothetical protein
MLLCLLLLLLTRLRCCLHLLGELRCRGKGIRFAGGRLLLRGRKRAKGIGLGRCCLGSSRPLRLRRLEVRCRCRLIWWSGA